MHDYSYIFTFALVAMFAIAYCIYRAIKSYRKATKRLKQLSTEQQVELLKEVNSKPSDTSSNIFKRTALSKMDLFD